MRPEEFKAYFGETIEENLNDVNAKENLDDNDNDNDNYDHLSQLKMNKHVHEARWKRKLQVENPEYLQKISKAIKTWGTSSSHVQKATMVHGEKTWSAPMFLDEELPWGTLIPRHHLLLVLG